MVLDKRVSDHLVRLVGIMFGVVVVQSFARYDELVVDPFGRDHLIGVLALLSVYFTVVMSWIDWHTTMELRPYALNPNNSSRRTEQVRLWADLGVVAAYAYLLFTIADFSEDPTRSVGRHLIGYPLVFATYIASGLTRRLTYGRYASNVRVIGTFSVLYVLLAAVYPHAQGVGAVHPEVLNAAALLEALLLMVLYRLIRRGASESRKRRKDRGPVIGIDIDGVLANQIDGIIPRIYERTGIELTYDDVTEWRLPLNHTDIATEIIAAMDDERYILEMPAHSGAQKVTESLYEAHRLYVITARPEETGLVTEHWLLNNKIPFDRLINVKGEKKSLYRTDILIDDYIGNIFEFLTNTNGWAILIDQPWNRVHDKLQDFVREGRLCFARNLAEARKLVVERGSRLRRS